MSKKVENKLKEEVKEIKVDGNVSLGDPAPSHKLEVTPTTKVGLGGGDNPAQKFKVTAGGKVGLGGPDLSEKFLTEQPKLKVAKVEQPAGHTTRAFRQ